MKNPFKILGVNPPSGVTNSNLWKKAVAFQFAYSMAGLVLGLVCVIGGIVLFFHGVDGSSSWTAKLLGLETTVSDTAPGGILFLVGLFVVWITKFDVGAGGSEKESAPK